MTLEDFFTLTELKDGVSTVSRIEELVSAIEKLKHCAGNNMSDSIRQWSAVANTLASTKNTECLKHFVQLKGICFLSQWLQEAQKYGNNVSGEVAEEFMKVLLALLELLPIDNEQSISSGIKASVEELLSHGNVEIKEKAKLLYDKWCSAKDDGIKCSPENSHTAEEVVGTRNGEHDLTDSIKAQSDPTVSRCSNNKKSNASNNGKFSLSNQIPEQTSSDSTGGNAVLGDSPATSFPKKETSLVSSDIENFHGETYLMRTKEVEPMNMTTEPIDKKSSRATEYDDDMDALEVAVQVAIEVKRDVVDYREASCSSPEVNSGDTGSASEPDVEDSKQSQPTTQENNGRNSSSLKEDGSGITENPSSNSVKHDQDSNLTSCTQVSDSKSERDRCGFDLNVDYNCTGEIDCSMKPVSNDPMVSSAPILVAASKGAPVIPLAPLQFDSGSGWKGSAATSAFRPASPRRASEKQKVSFSGIDLNVVESEDAVTVEDSSIEIGSRREKINLDLNQNGDQSLSSASSSSSRQPVFRDFDLNENLFNIDNSGSHATQERDKLSNTAVITIMGSRMAVGRNDLPTQTQQSFLPSWPNTASRDALRSLPPYPHMPPHLVPIPPAFYVQGSIPYMVDSRGTPVVPQIVGPGSNNAPSVRPPFTINLMGAPLSDQFGVFRPGLHANYGTAPVESGTRPLLQRHNGLVDEHGRSVSQPSSSVMSLKRKEPDFGWGQHEYNYKYAPSQQ
uniref:TFIIS N-terminal domain-containing protein n=1 Tax=Ananas comosus var. bracteatus TaxID=296719 RepID=A0A6V7PI74_ANACO|nr:unnamed protein product [Ananas comosus var. bracteatus]